jgi:predicted esterase
MSAIGSHAGQPLLTSGRRAEESAAAAILVHGRGASAGDIMSVAEELEQPELAYLAPQAADFTWYPHSFLAPIEANEPSLSSALSVIGSLVDELDGKGVPAARVILVGFSQGACLALEFAARNAQRFGAVIGFTGGLIGPPGTTREYAGDFAGTPVFLGSGDPDPHVPWSRVEETAEVFRGMAATVDLRRYPRMPHTINSDELGAARALVHEVV